MLINLISNAFKFTEHGFISIKVKANVCNFSNSLVLDHVVDNINMCSKSQKIIMSNSNDLPSIQVDDSIIKISIKDSGAGIPKENIG